MYNLVLPVHILGLGYSSHRIKKENKQNCWNIKLFQEYDFFFFFLNCQILFIYDGNILEFSSFSRTVSFHLFHKQLLFNFWKRTCFKDLSLLRMLLRWFVFPFLTFTSILQSYLSPKLTDVYTTSKLWAPKIKQNIFHLNIWMYWIWVHGKHTWTIQLSQCELPCIMYSRCF